MEFVQLTEAQRQEFEENGYFIMRSVLDDEMIGRLTEAGDRLMASLDLNGGHYGHRRDGLVQEPAFAELVSQTNKSDPLGDSTPWHEYPHYQYRAPLQASAATRTP